MSKMDKLNRILEENLSPNKWKFYYEYARKSLDEDIQRFQQIDEKAAKFLTLVTAVFAIFSAISPWVFENQFPPKENYLSF